MDRNTGSQIFNDSTVKKTSFNEQTTLPVSGKRSFLEEDSKAGRGSWLRRFTRQHPTYFTLFLALSSFNDGLGVMRALCIRNIYKERFEVEATELQKYAAIIQIPVLFRMFFGIIVDAKVVSERKYYIIVFNLLAAIPMYIIGNDRCNGPAVVLANLFFYSTCHQFLEATVSSLAIE